MNVAQQIGEASRSLALDSAATDYTRYVKALGVQAWLFRKHSLRIDTLQIATAKGASSRLRAMCEVPPETIAEVEKQIMLSPSPYDAAKLRNQIVQKSAVAVGSIDGGTWGSQLAAFQESSAGFVQSLAPFSSFDRILNDGGFTRTPLRTHIAVASSAAIGSTVSELATKPITQLSFSNAYLPAHKAIGEFVFSHELVLSTTAASNKRFESELQKAVAKASDTKFLEIVTEGTGVASSPSSGLTAGALYNDLLAALETIEVGAGSKLYFILPANIATKASVLRDSGGPFVVSGKIGNINVIPTSADTADGILLDASAVAADSELAITRVSDQSTVRLDDNPTSGTHRYVSLWQNNLMMFLTERYFGAAVLRPNGIAVISGMATA
jgi:hypothetical protein